MSLGTAAFQAMPAEKKDGADRQYSGNALSPRNLDRSENRNDSVFNGSSSGISRDDHSIVSGRRSTNSKFVYSYGGDEPLSFVNGMANQSPK